MITDAVSLVADQSNSVLMGRIPNPSNVINRVMAKKLAKYKKGYNHYKKRYTHYKKQNTHHKKRYKHYKSLALECQQRGLAPDGGAGDGIKKALPFLIGGGALLYFVTKKKKPSKRKRK